METQENAVIIEAAEVKKSGLRMRITAPQMLNAEGTRSEVT